MASVPAPTRKSRETKISEIILNDIPTKTLSCKSKRRSVVVRETYIKFRNLSKSQNQMSNIATTARTQISFERAFRLPLIQIEAAVLSRYRGQASCECSQCRLNRPVSNGGNEARSMPPPTRFARPTYAGLPPKGPSYSVEPAQAANSGPIGTSAVQVDRLVVPTISG